MTAYVLSRIYGTIRSETGTSICLGSATESGNDNRLVRYVARLVRYEHMGKFFPTTSWGAETKQAAAIRSRTPPESVSPR